MIIDYLFPELMTKTYLVKGKIALDYHGIPALQNSL